MGGTGGAFERLDLASRRRFNSFKPVLAPPRIDAARTVHPATAVTRAAPNIFQNHGCCLHFSHSSSLLVEEFLHPRPDAIPPSAIGYLLGVEGKAAVSAFLIQRRKDLFIRLHPDPLARLEVQCGRWRELTYGNLPVLAREWNTSPQRLKPIIKPSRRDTATPPPA